MNCVSCCKFLWEKIAKSAKTRTENGGGKNNKLVVA